MTVFSHAIIFVRDMARSVAFYRDSNHRRRGMEARSSENCRRRAKRTSCE